MDPSSGGTLTSEGVEQRSLRIDAEPFIAVNAPERFFSGTAASLGSLWRRRELLWLLTRREVAAKYKDSALGVVWSLVRPIAQLLIYWFAIGIVLGAQRSVPDFAIFVFIGLTMWSLFADVVTMGASSVVTNAGIVKKVKLPLDVFPLSAVGSALFSFGAQFLVLLIALAAFARFPLDADLLYAPFSFAILLVWSTAFSLFLSAFTVYFRDVQHIVEVGLVILFWLSPIVYSFTFVHAAFQGSWVEQIYLANPVTVAIIGMQEALWLGGDTATGPLAQTFPPDLLLRSTIMLVIGIVVLWVAQRVFSRLSRNFAQEL